MSKISRGLAMSPTKRSTNAILASIRFVGVRMVSFLYTDNITNNNESVVNDDVIPTVNEPNSHTQNESNTSTNTNNNHIPKIRFIGYNGPHVTITHIVNRPAITDNIRDEEEYEILSCDMCHNYGPGGMRCGRCCEDSCATFSGNVMNEVDSFNAQRLMDAEDEDGLNEMQAQEYDI